MVSSNKIVSDLVELCYAHGVRHIVLSPGSRNAPFTISFQEDERFQCYVIPDERSAGFFALGLAQFTKEITAICCTSGTAAVNYGPAIAEAYYQRIPLLAITADRPEEWIDQGVGQSLQQKDLYRNFILKAHSLPSDQRRHQYAARLVNEVLLYAKGEIPGPVHLNVPLYEPLYETIENSNDLPRIVRKAKLFSKVDSKEIQSLAKIWNQKARKLIVIGALEKDEDLERHIQTLAQDPSVAVLTETHANLTDPNFHPSIDRLIEGLDKKDQIHYKPDILMTFGQNLISKKLKYMLYDMDIEEHWHIDPNRDLVDTYHNLTVQIDDQAHGFFNSFTPHCEPNLAGEYKALWKELEDLTKSAHGSFVEDMAYSDFSVFRDVLRQIPSGTYVQMGNSASVRYIQLFPQRADIIYHGNRGVSGIDGCTSTAAGAAWLNPNLTCLLTGDISFLYDVNGLWHPYLHSKLRIIVVNNRGGGIFRIIPGPNTTNQLESTFEARHYTEAKHVAETYGLHYQSSHNQEELREVLESFFDDNQEGKASILEIFTPTEINDVVLGEYFQFLKKKVYANHAL